MSTPAHTFLANLLSSGILEPTYEAYINELRRKPSFFYARTRAEQGHEAAEAELATWVQDNHIAEFAGSLKPIAEGLLALAETSLADGLFTHALPNEVRGVWFPRHVLPDNAEAVTLRNPEFTGCGWQPPVLLEPRRSRSFPAMHAALGLKALAFARIEDEEDKVELVLVLPLRTLKPDPKVIEGYSVVCIGPRGTLSTSRFTLHMPDEDFFLDALLGRSSQLEPHNVVSAFGGEPNNAIGFPGAVDFLAKYLTGLGPFLIAAADALTTSPPQAE